MIKSVANRRNEQSAAERTLEEWKEYGTGVGETWG